VRNQNHSAGLNNAEQKYFDELSLYRLDKKLSNDDIVSKIKEFRTTNNMKLLDEVIYNFINLLMKKAWKHKKPDIDARDLIFYGVEGLIDAISYSFNVDSKNKFITYATWVVDRRMKDGVDYNRSVIKLPRHKLIEQRKSKFGKSKAKQFMDPDIITKINVKSHDDFKKIIFENDPDSVEHTIERNLDADSLKADISRVFNNILTKIEVEVMEYLYGLNDKIKLPIPMIAKRLDLSTKDVTEIAKDAITKIRSNKQALTILKKYMY